MQAYRLVDGHDNKQMFIRPILHDLDHFQTGECILGSRPVEQIRWVFEDNFVSSP